MLSFDILSGTCCLAFIKPPTQTHSLYSLPAPFIRTEGPRSALFISDAQARALRERATLLHTAKSKRSEICPSDNLPPLCALRLVPLCIRLPHAVTASRYLTRSSMDPGFLKSHWYIPVIVGDSVSVAFSWERWRDRRHRSPFLFSQDCTKSRKRWVWALLAVWY